MAMFENRNNSQYTYHHHALSYNPYGVQPHQQGSSYHVLGPFQNLYSGNSTPESEDNMADGYIHGDYSAYSSGVQTHSPNLIARSFGEEHEDLEDASSGYLQFPHLVHHHHHQNNTYDASRCSTPSTISSGSSIDSQSTEDGSYLRIHHYDETIASPYPINPENIQYYDNSFRDHSTPDFADPSSILELSPSTSIVDWSQVETEEQIEQATELCLRKICNIPPNVKVDLHAVPDKGKSDRPDISCPNMIKLAIFGSEKKKLTLKGIYAAIEERFEYYRQGKDASWKNSVRHTLSLKSAFRKQPREAVEPGKGSYWCLDLSQGEGNKRKRYRNYRKSKNIVDGDEEEDVDSGRSDAPNEDLEDENRVEGGNIQFQVYTNGPKRGGTARSSSQRRPAHLGISPYSPTPPSTSGIHVRPRSGSNSSARSIRSRSGSTSSPLNPNIARSPSFVDNVQNMNGSPVPSPLPNHVILPSTPYMNSPYPSPMIHLSVGDSQAMPNLLDGSDPIHRLSSNISHMHMEPTEAQLLVFEHMPPQ